MSTIWQKKNLHRAELKNDIAAMLEASKACGWLGEKSAPILLKPNLVVSKPATGGATTHPEIAAALIEYLSDKGYTDIRIAEGSWVGDSTQKAYKTCGYTDLQKRYGIELIDLQKDGAAPVEIMGEQYKICRSIADLENNGGSLINLPVLKGHGQTRVTCALKNLKGCIPDSEKRRYHTLGVHNPVALLNTVIKPAFALVDGLNGDPYWEEGGSPEKRDLLLLGRDPVSVDSYACMLLGVEPSDIKYIRIAGELGIGNNIRPETDVIDLDGNSPAQKMKPAGSAEAEKIISWIEQITDQRSACSACFGNLASALRSFHYSDRKAAEAIAEKSICIGQDFRGNEITGSLIGVGKCVKGGFEIKGCPPSEQSILESLESFIM